MVAEALAWAGANVAVLDRSAEAGERLVQKIDRSDAGGRVLFIQTDVLQRDSLAAAEARIRAELGPVDALVNTAGGNHPAATTGAYAAGGAPAPSFFDLTEAGMRAVFDLNFLGTFLPCQAFGLGMVERGEGAILNITSIVSVRPLTRIPAYAAAKAAVSSFTQWLAVYMAQNHSPRIRVNALAPGFFMSEQSRFLALDSETGEVSPRARQRDRTHTGRAIWRARGAAGGGLVAALTRFDVRDRLSDLRRRRLHRIQRGVKPQDPGEKATAARRPPHRVTGEEWDRYSRVSCTRWC